MKILRILFIVVALLSVLVIATACEEETCAHDYVSGSVTPECEKELVISEVCSKCGDTREKTVTPTGHSFKKNTVAATCTGEGYTDSSCSCGFSYKTDIISAKNHTFSETVVSPECDSIGYTLSYCDICGFTYKKDYVDTLGHSLTSFVTDPDCENEGYTDYSCDLCGFNYKGDYLEPLGHALISETTAPDCENGGFTAYSCENCDYSYVSDYIEPTGHSFTSFVKSRVGCTTKGETEHTCDCGYSYSEIIAPLGHDFTKVVTSPTVSDMGYTEFYCDCGFSYKGNYRFYSDILDNAYAGNDKVVARGIDISKWNHTVDKNGNYEPIDWEALKAAGVDYVILKIGSTVRNNGEDGGLEPTFLMDYEGAKAAGIDVGAYFFTYSTSVSQIKKDAELVSGWLEGLQLEYPVYLDLEDSEKEDYFASQIASPILTEMCLEFFSALQREGYYTGLYVNNEFLFNILQTENMIDLFEIWYARYTTLNAYEWSDSDTESYVWNTEKYGEHLGMWQYSMTGLLPPIVGSVDFNYAYKDYPALIKANGFNGYPLNDDEIVENETETESEIETETVVESFTETE